MKSSRPFALAAFAAALVTAPTQAQTQPPLSQSWPLAVWSKTYGDPLPGENLFDLRRAANGDLLVAASSGPTATSFSSGWLVRLDATTGSVVSESTVGAGPGPSFDVIDGGALAADGGVLFTGRYVVDLFSKHDAWAVRVDAQGQPLWWYGFTRPLVGRHFLLDAVELPSGSWVVAGATSAIDEPPQRALVAKFSPAGQLEWYYEYGGGVVEQVQSVTPTQDGGVALAGTSNSSGAGSDDAWILKLDADGAIEWQWTYGGRGLDQARAIVELADGSFAVAATTDGSTASGYAPWILRLDAQGDLLWSVVVDGVWGDVQAIAPARRGGVVAHGRVGEPGFPTNDLWAVELDRAGNVRWQRAYEGASGDWGAEVLPLPSGLVLGGVWGSGFPEQDLWVTRTGPDGELAGCGLDRSTSFALLHPEVTVQAGAAVRFAGGAVELPLSFGPGTPTTTVIEQCE